MLFALLAFVRWIQQLFSPQRASNAEYIRGFSLKQAVQQTVEYLQRRVAYVT